MDDIILLGIGGHAHSVVDSIEQSGQYNIIGFLDTEDAQGKYFRKYRVLDTDDAMGRLYEEGLRYAFITIGFMGHGDLRNRLYRRLKKIGYTLPNIVDDSAVIARDAILEDGIFVGKRAVINANARIQKMCIINTGAIIEHDCKVEEFTHVAVGGILCGNVFVGRDSFVGANATVIQEKKIGGHCIIGAGTVVRKSMEDFSVMYGETVKKRAGGDCPKTRMLTA